MGEFMLASAGKGKASRVVTNLVMVLTLTYVALTSRVNQLSINPGRRGYDVAALCC